MLILSAFTYLSRFHYFKYSNLNIVIQIGDKDEKSVLVLY
jgi:hypothetical protein